MIEFKNVTKIYKPNKGIETIALNNLSFKLPDKGMVFITGKSGSGKSTLLNVLGGLDTINSGEILINDSALNCFKNKDLDNYRNTYVGFVFQEYNLLDEYNVYKNIELALSLQKKVTSKKTLEDIIQFCGLSGLEKRNINELSGGQKQRVAIARALIKDPAIVLADEPTGNLDEKTSIQIIELLKQLSRNRLVIIVTHEISYAKKYGDYIIEMLDGNIAQNRIISKNIYKEKKLDLINGKFDFRKLIGLAYANIKAKKARLLFTIILVTIAISLFGFASTLTYFNIPKTHANTMEENNVSQVEIHKTVNNKNFTEISPTTAFTNSELIEVQKKLNNSTIKVSYAVENNNYLGVNYAEVAPSSDRTYAYYDISKSDVTRFLEYNDEEMKRFKIIGNYPNENNEVLIHKVFADYIIKNGLSIVNEKKDDLKKTADYFPKDYNDIVNSKKKVILGSSFIIITGIIDEDTTKYETLKNTLSKEMDINPSKLYREFINTNKQSAFEIIVNNRFFDSLMLKKNNVLSVDLYKPVYSYNSNDMYTYSSLKYLDQKITYYNGIKEIETDTLEDNEIIITTFILDEMFDNEPSKLMEDYRNKKYGEYQNAIKERTKKIEEQQEKLLQDPNYVIEDIPEILPFDPYQVQKDFVYKYVREKELIGQKIDITINDMYLRTSKYKENTISDITIIGIDAIGYEDYLSKNAIQKYMRDNKETKVIYFNEKNENELEKLFNEFPPSNAKYISKTIYSNEIINVEKIVSKIKNIAYYSSFGFLIFAILLFMNFIIISINGNKKKIGILRALGAKKKDIFNIFFIESLLMGVFVFALSSIICYFSCILCNNLISNTLFFKIKPIIFRYETIFITLVTIIIVIIISSIIPTIKISKMNPFDAINEK